MSIRPIIFSVNCYIATILTMFIAFSLDLKSPGWAMTTVYLTSQPLSGVLRAKAVYRIIGTIVGGAAMVAIVPNLIDAPELTTLAIILWVALCVFVSLLDRTPRSYMFVLSGYTAALIGFPSVLAPGTVFDTAVSRVEEITLGVVCAAIVHSLIFPKSAFSAFEEKLRKSMADARRWLADGLVKQATPQAEMERRRIAADISELYVLGTSLRFDTSPHRPDMGIIRAFDRKIVALLPLVTAIEDRLTVLRRLGPLDPKLSQALADVYDWLDVRLRRSRSRRRAREACLAATPAVGPHVSLTYRATVDIPARFRKSKSVGAVFGLTCAKYQSGEVDWDGRISRCGDEMMRTMLYEAAQAMMRSKKWSWLKAWAMQIARRRGMKKAIVALARRLAVIMHRIWVDGTEFRWTREQAAAAA